MNVFGAITIMVFVTGAVFGSFTADVTLRNCAPVLRLVAIPLSGLAVGYICRKMYLWCLNRMADQANRKRSSEKAPQQKIESKAK
jgi:uncharacterized membrane protein